MFRMFVVWGFDSEGQFHGADKGWDDVWVVHLLRNDGATMSAVQCVGQRSTHDISSKYEFCVRLKEEIRNG